MGARERGGSEWRICCPTAAFLEKSKKKKRLPSFCSSADALSSWFPVLSFVHRRYILGESLCMELKGR